MLLSQVWHWRNKAFTKHLVYAFPGAFTTLFLNSCNNHVNCVLLAFLLQMRKWRLRKVKWLSQVHAASEWHWGSISEPYVGKDVTEFLLFTWSLLQLSKDFILPEASQNCVDKCVMLGWVPGVDENIIKIYDQSLVQQVLEDSVGIQLSYYTG